VARRLEQGAALALVFVCRSAEPPELTRHVLQLAAQRGVPVCAFNGLEAVLAARLRIRHAAVAAIGGMAPTDPPAPPSLAALLAAVAPLLAGPSPPPPPPYQPAAVRRVPADRGGPPAKRRPPPGTPAPAQPPQEMRLS
jgi:hypothetical protein